MTVVTEIKPEIRAALYMNQSQKDEKALSQFAESATRYSCNIEREKTSELVGIYIDFSTEGCAVNRPRFQKMLKEIKEKRINRIFIESVYELGESGEEAARAAQKLIDTHITVVVISDGEYLRSPGAYPDYERYYQFTERKERREREKKVEAIKNKIVDGTSKYYKRPCYGYRAGEDGRLHIYEPEAKVVRLIYELSTKKYSIRAIIASLTERNIPSPTGKEKWCNRAIVSILNNPKYVGMIAIDDIAIDGTHEAIISGNLAMKAKIRMGLLSNEAGINNG